MAVRSAWRVNPACSPVHPCATTWPSSPQWEACHWILSRLSTPYESSSLATSRGRKTLRKYPWCHQCCMTESQSLLPLEEGVAVRRRMIAAFQRKAEALKGPDVTHSVYHELSVFLRAPPSSFLRKEPYVTGRPLVSPAMHDGLLKSFPQPARHSEPKAKNLGTRR